MNLDFGKWKNLGIGTRLILIAFLPVTFLFCFVVLNSFHARFTEAQEELAENGRLISTALAESVDYEVIPGNYGDIRRMMSGLIQADTSIFSIVILNAENREVVQVANPASLGEEMYSYDAPIRKRVLSINTFDELGAPNVSDQSDTPHTVKAEIIGYVRVTMSTANIRDKHTRRFIVQSGMALFAMIISILLATLLARSLTRPLAVSIDALRKIQAGEKSVQMKITTGGEIGDLQRSINEMSESVEQSKQYLENKISERTKELQASRNKAVKSNAEKRKLIQKVNTAVEDERRSIAIEIHDELNATLIAVRLNADRIRNLTTQAESRPVVNEIQDKALEIGKLALGLYTSGRNIVRRLRPEVLELLGLNGAIEEMVRQYNLSYPDCRFSFRAKGDFTTLESDLSITVYRLVQEALSNVVKHSMATKATVTLLMGEGNKSLQIVVSDNGSGFDSTVLKRTQGIGIIGMRERVYAYSGRIKFRSGTGHGTEIVVNLPLKLSEDQAPA